MSLIAGTLVRHRDDMDLARRAAEEFRDLAREAVASRGRFAAALTGGSSPEALYRLLGTPPFAEEIPWSDVHLFWGDDRVVPPRHPRSNYGLAHRLFLTAVPIPSANVHRVHGEVGAARAAERYERELEEFFRGPPRFDLVHLGLGEDGHVASLFPFDRGTLLERRRMARATLLRSLGEWRVTVTLPVLTGAARVEFLLPDVRKAQIARRAMVGPIDPIRIPAQGVRPARGELIWRVTRELADAARIGSDR